MTSVDAAGCRLDLRLVPAALSSWAVTAAGILWQVGGSAAAVTAAIAITAATGWWSSGRRDGEADLLALRAGVVAVAVVGVGFALAVGLRVEELRHHPIVDRYGTVATVVVTPTESPRTLNGGRMMFRASLRILEGQEMIWPHGGFRVGRLRGRVCGPTGRLPGPSQPADSTRPDRRGVVGDGRADIR